MDHKPVCRIIIDLMPDGRVIPRGNAPSRAVMNSMIVTAHQDMLAWFREQERKEASGEAVQVAPPGFQPK